MSPVAKLWTGSAWQEAPISGKVLTGSYDFSFAPSAGGPSYESITWVGAPTLTTGNDANQDYTMGVVFDVLTSKPCYGVNWRVPDVINSTPSGGSWYAKLWKDTDGSQLAAKSFNPTGHEGTTFDILFDTPVTLTNTDFYVATVFTRDYVFRSKGVGSSSGTSPSGNIEGADGRLAATSDPSVFPSSTFGAIYFISPLVGL